MSVDANAVARVLGITTQYKDLRGGRVLFLPQRIAVLAQGASASSYSSTKFQATSASQVGAIAGYGSPAHLIAKQLFPANGDGVGTIPVTFYLLQDAGGGSAPAEGNIVPSGTQTEAAEYVARVNNIESEPFVIAANDSVTARCVAMWDAITAVLSMPVIPTFTYGTVTAAADGGNAGDGTVTVLSAPGQPRPGAWVLECTSEVANGGVFSLTDPDGVLVADDVTMTPAPGGATVINEGGLQFTITDGAADFEVGDLFTITVPATNVVLTAKWEGVSSNALYVEVEGDDLGTTFTITQPSGGLVNPDLDGALAQVGNIWETMFLNALDIDDEDALDALQTFGEGRWGELVRKPMVAFTGNTETTVANATAVCSTRRDDKVNAQLVAPGSKDLPFVVAARQLARIAAVANNNPPRDYGSQPATGLTPGDDGDQWTYVQRDQAVKAGSSTVEIKDGVVNISDVVTFYRPEGEEPPAYRYVVDIVKLQNIIFNLDLAFANPEWDGAPLIPDDQPTVNPIAKKPKMAVARAAGILDNLGLEAIISDPKTAKQNTSASLNSQNPKRLDLETTVQLSGNTNVKGVTLSFGFYFGTSALVA